jgi:hypothetical protein
MTEKRHDNRRQFCTHTRVSTAPACLGFRRKMCYNTGAHPQAGRSLSGTEGSRRHRQKETSHEF